MQQNEILHVLRRKDGWEGGLKNAMGKKNELWLVSRECCGDCQYYGTLGGGQTGTRCCNYTVVTGRIRKKPPKSCEVKKPCLKAR